ncbi:hypothetical protein AAFF_G00393770 [Aldrovandia affinis]|uniref:Uncharacterized protein n=1 Tax=Aldrovandia affinis TaxID=143900 RepID=A0AAD7SE08_9TELE|nr:hypothetical protein AAFF_G00393770 [Aldrovandia affinis]
MLTVLYLSFLHLWTWDGNMTTTVALMRSVRLYWYLEGPKHAELGVNYEIHYKLHPAPDQAAARGGPGHGCRRSFQQTYQFRRVPPAGYRHQQQQH